MYEQLGQLYTDNDFESLYPRCGQSAMSPAKLALVTVMQFAEGLTDRQAADAVRSRIDWKYALGLEITDSGFDHTILKEFRERLIAKEKENLLLEKMLLILSSQKLVKARGQARTDSTHVLAAIRHLNRLELVGETLRQALNELATHAPTWLLTQIGTDWFDRYGSRLDEYRLPKDKTERSQLALTIGTDGHHILQAVDEATNLPQLRELKTVKILRSVWVQQYVFVKGKLLWRDRKTTGMAPNKQLIESPYDPEARNATKRDTNWTGYKVHLTETCDENSPHIITNVETTPAPTIVSECNANIKSFPLPPVMKSSPAPPTKMSCPSPPCKVSLPLSPLR
ncbi:MAG: transposase [Hormoscilla sp. GM7CHS1pb]|nr:transposase [Hormoscilla sp. GM7CHS1pb]